MDISQSLSNHVSKKGSPHRYADGEMVSARLWKALGLLFVALVLSMLFGMGAMWILRHYFPHVPTYVALPFFVVILTGLLRAIIVRYPWIAPWYYLLPAIIFLVTFALFPVLLTVTLAFTDYAGIRNGELNISSKTDIDVAEGARLTVSNIDTLLCDDLRQGCLGVTIEVTATNQRTVQAVALEQATLTLATPLVEDEEPKIVELYLEDFGFNAKFNIISYQEKMLTLERPPPGTVDLQRVTLELPTQSIRRKIVSIEENTLILDQPLPDDAVSYTHVIRYNDFGFVGVKNFSVIFLQASRALVPVFLWNVLFAFSTILINAFFGVVLAIFLNNPHLRFRNFYRTLLIVPWALPSVITIQVWKGFLNANFGAMNRILALLDLPVLNWLGDVWPARAAILLVNLWLGLPFMMTASLGALSAIPTALYEAAKIDGANLWQRITSITLPLLRNALVPITLTGFAFAFNNFTLIYLLTGGGPGYAGGMATARSTDILISWAYNEAFQAQGGYAYGLGSAISLIIFLITLAISFVNFNVTGALKDERGGVNK